MSLFREKHSDQDLANAQSALHCAALLLQNDKWLFESPANDVHDREWQGSLSSHDGGRGDSALRTVFGKTAPRMTSKNTFLPSNQKSHRYLINFSDAGEPLEDIGSGNYTLGTELRYKTRVIGRSDNLSSEDGMVRLWMATLPSNWRSIDLGASISSLATGGDIAGSQQGHILGFVELARLAEFLSRATTHSMTISETITDGGAISETHVRWVWPLHLHRIAHGSWADYPNIEGDTMFCDLEASIDLKVSSDVQAGLQPSDADDVQLEEEPQRAW